MHRKLIHSVRALGIALSLLTGSLITAGLGLAVPATAPDGIAADADAGAAPSAAAKAQATSSAAKAHLRRRTQARDAMALPFFSFAQGLRRGNRS